MKKLLAVFAVLVMIITSCSKQAEQQSASTVFDAPVSKQTMTVAEVKSNLGIDLISAEAQANITTRKPNKLTAGTTVNVWFNDIQLTGAVVGSNDSLHTTLPVSATFGGVQSALALSGTGTLDTTSMASRCNWFASSGETSKDCIVPSAGTTFYRSWSSDVFYDIHVSSLKQLPE